MRIPELGSIEASPELRPLANQAAPSQQEVPGHIAADHSEVSTAASAAIQDIQKRDSRVAELRQQYLNGSYQPDAGRVAAKIVDEHLG
ncbi:MAG TPA: flagellar biosynthesis anti-sigma factor FlgM [Bryobacteraceae bacterium]|nr:flagellar biosynthesis anti-sigma factor FlgM [Bryobacteraceae bacterium]